MQQFSSAPEFNLEQIQKISSDKKTTVQKINKFYTKLTKMQEQQGDSRSTVSLVDSTTSSKKLTVASSVELVET